MNLLLDSHTFLWFVWNDPKLSIGARLAIEDPSNRKWISIASIWEIGIKCGLGKLELGDPIDVFFAREVKINGFSILNIETSHVACAALLPFHHRDPFDRMLIAQATIDKFCLVSTDSHLDAYCIQRIW